MLTESEQGALDQIREFLDAGHDLSAIRAGGWGSWIDHLESKGIDPLTGELRIRRRETVPPPSAEAGDVPLNQETTRSSPKSDSLVAIPMAGQCSTCGKDMSFFKRLIGRSLCGSCKRALNEAKTGAGIAWPNYVSLLPVALASTHSSRTALRASSALSAAPEAV